MESMDELEKKWDMVSEQLLKHFICRVCRERYAIHYIIDDEDSSIIPLCLLCFREI